MSIENRKNEILALPDNHHWSGVDFERYLLGVIKNGQLIDFHNAPREIDLSKSIVGTVADKLYEKIDQGKRYEYGAEIRTSANNNLFATKLSTDYSFRTTETHSQFTELKDFLRAILFKTKGFSNLWEHFPPEKELFRLHSHPVDVPVSSSDTNTITQFKESNDFPWRIDSSHCGLLVVTKSKRMLALATKQSPVIDTIIELENENQKIYSEVEIGDPTQKVTKKEINIGPIPPEKYPGFVNRAIYIYTGIAHRRNFLMYASKDMEDQRNIYTRSY